MLQIGQAPNHTDLARQLGTNSARITEMLALFRLALAIQDVLVKTHDFNGLVRERTPRPVLRFKRPTQHLRTFRETMRRLKRRNPV